MTQRKNEHDKAYRFDYFLVYFGKDISDVRIDKLVFRGDSRHSIDIFKSGFIAQGTCLNLIDHIRQPDFSFNNNSAYVSTSTRLESAMEFPHSAVNRKNFLYEILSPKNAIDVLPVLKNALENKIITEFNFEIYVKENELAVPHKIETTHIKGAWEVNFQKVDVDGKSTWVRKLDTDSYRHNPHFKPHKILSTANTIGRVATAVGLGMDGARLYGNYQDCLKTNDFTPFYQESVQVLSGWTGGFALGHIGALAGGKIGLLGGPIGSAFGTVIGGAVGSMVGYYYSSEVVKQSQTPTSLAIDRKLTVSCSTTSGTFFASPKKTSSLTVDKHLHYLTTPQKHLQLPGMHVTLSPSQHPIDKHLWLASVNCNKTPTNASQPLDMCNEIATSCIVKPEQIYTDFSNNTSYSLGLFPFKPQPLSSNDESNSHDCSDGSSYGGNNDRGGRDNYIGNLDNRVQITICFPSGGNGWKCHGPDAHLFNR